MQQDVEKYLEKIEKKKSIAETFVEGCVLFSGISVSMALTALLIGGASKFSSNISYKQIYNNVIDSKEFQEQVVLKQSELEDRYNLGDITFNEYNAKKSQLYSHDEIVDFAKTNDIDSDFVDSYLSTKDCADVTLNKGVPSMLSIASVGLVGSTFCELIRRRYDRILAQNKQDIEEEQEM